MRWAGAVAARDDQVVRRASRRCRAFITGTAGAKQARFCLLGGCEWLEQRRCVGGKCATVRASWKRLAQDGAAPVIPHKERDKARTLGWALYGRTTSAWAVSQNGRDGEGQEKQGQRQGDEWQEVGTASLDHEVCSGEREWVSGELGDEGTGT